MGVGWLQELLRTLLPPLKKENLAGLRAAMEESEVALLGLFRQCCFCIPPDHHQIHHSQQRTSNDSSKGAAGGGGGEDRSAVTARQFRQLARDDAGVLRGEHALSQADVDQVFLRAMLDRTPHASLPPPLLPFFS